MQVEEFQPKDLRGSGSPDSSSPKPMEKDPDGRIWSCSDDNSVNDYDGFPFDDNGADIDIEEDIVQNRDDSEVQEVSIVYTELDGGVEDFATRTTDVEASDKRECDCTLPTYTFPAHKSGSVQMGRQKSKSYSTCETSRYPDCYGFTSTPGKMCSKYDVHQYCDRKESALSMEKPDSHRDCDMICQRRYDQSSYQSLCEADKTTTLSKTRPSPKNEVESLGPFTASHFGNGKTFASLIGASRKTSLANVKTESSKKISLVDEVEELSNKPTIENENNQMSRKESMVTSTNVASAKKFIENGRGEVSRNGSLQKLATGYSLKTSKDISKKAMQFDSTKQTSGEFSNRAYDKEDFQMPSTYFETDISRKVSLSKGAEDFSGKSYPVMNSIGAAQKKLFVDSQTGRTSQDMLHVPEDETSRKISFLNIEDVNGSPVLKNKEVKTESFYLGKNITTVSPSNKPTTPLKFTELSRKSSPKDQDTKAFEKNSHTEIPAQVSRRGSVLNTRAELPQDSTKTWRNESPLRRTDLSAVPRPQQSDPSLTVAHSVSFRRPEKFHIDEFDGKMTTQKNFSIIPNSPLTQVTENSLRANPSQTSAQKLAVNGKLKRKIPLETQSSKQNISVGLSSREQKMEAINSFDTPENIPREQNGLQGNEEKRPIEYSRSLYQSPELSRAALERTENLQEDRLNVRSNQDGAIRGGSPNYGASNQAGLDRSTLDKLYGNEANTATFFSTTDLNYEPLRAPNKDSVSSNKNSKKASQRLSAPRKPKAKETEQDSKIKDGEVQEEKTNNSNVKGGVSQNKCCECEPCSFTPSKRVAISSCLDGRPFPSNSSLSDRKVTCLKGSLASGRTTNMLGREKAGVDGGSDWDNSDTASFKNKYFSARKFQQQKTGTTAGYEKCQELISPAHQRRSSPCSSLDSSVQLSNKTKQARKFKAKVRLSPKAKCGTEETEDASQPVCFEFSENDTVCVDRDTPLGHISACTTAGKGGAMTTRVRFSCSPPKNSTSSPKEQQTSSYVTSGKSKKQPCSNAIKQCDEDRNQVCVEDMITSPKECSSRTKEQLQQEADTTGSICTSLELSSEYDVIVDTKAPFGKL